MVDITKSGGTVTAAAPEYCWLWQESTDSFTLSDAEGRVISTAPHQIVLALDRAGVSAHSFTPNKPEIEIRDNRVRFTYRNDALASVLSYEWIFFPDFLCLEGVTFSCAGKFDIVNVSYFSLPGAEGRLNPAMYARYLAVPGLCMSANVSPVIDLQSKLSVTACLGSGAMRGPGFAQQWGLPSHYFAAFSTPPRWNAIGAKDCMSAAACWGLKELPCGDYRLVIRDIGASPLLNVRSDIWHHLGTPGEINTGFSFVVTFGKNYHEAARNYYKKLLALKVVDSKAAGNSPEKNKTLLNPQYNTWGAEVSLAVNPENMTQAHLDSFYAKFRASGMQAKTFVVDDKWEGSYGELRHDGKRFPDFPGFLDRVRQDGYGIGLWAAFLRCEDPTVLGLNDSHLLRTPDGKPLRLAHQSAGYGIYDTTQQEVRDALGKRAKEFAETYRPDLIKFDFGYELPSLDVAAPFDLGKSGELLIRSGLETVIGAVKKVNPDIVVMYYGLSPLLIDYYDLHSPDDLVYCNGDYDLETNRRVFFSSLCGEIGMPTYSSSGYDWASAPDIWFDTALSGTPGSLHCFDGDENGGTADDRVIAKYNGTAAVRRKTCSFSVYPVDAEFSGGFRAALSSSWERKENGITVSLALRPVRLDGKKGLSSFGDIVSTSVAVVVSSLTGDGIAGSARVGIVPFGNGRIHIRKEGSEALIAEHCLGGKVAESRKKINDGILEIELAETRGELRVEWIEVISPA